MNIQTAFVYCFLTMVIVFVFLFLEHKYFNADEVSKKGDNSNHNNKHLRISILCGLLNWIIIVYFIYMMEQTIPSIASNAQVILHDKF